MKALGYALTWKTVCFINGGCGKKGFAHTNGSGDFVLFDDLGRQWQIHDCCLDRFCLKSNRYTKTAQIRHEAINEYRHADVQLPIRVTKKPPDTRRIGPTDHLKNPKTNVLGYVKDTVHDHAKRLFKGLGTIGQTQVQATLGHNRSQLTIVTPDYKSYTAYADLQHTRVTKKDMIAARLKAVKVLGVPGTESISVCDVARLVWGNPSK